MDGFKPRPSAPELSHSTTSPRNGDSTNKKKWKTNINIRIYTDLRPGPMASQNFAFFCEIKKLKISNKKQEQKQ